MPSHNKWASEVRDQCEEIYEQILNEETRKLPAFHQQMIHKLVQSKK